jgi:hypothetical protein
VLNGGGQLLSKRDNETKELTWLFFSCYGGSFISGLGPVRQRYNATWHFSWRDCMVDPVATSEA